jgi:hypothetical protein
MGEEKFKGLAAGFLVMALTAEIVYQALVLSSIFLMAISLPKLLIYTAWSSWRMYVYEHMMESRTVRKLLSDKTIQESLKPDQKFERTVKEMESYTRDMKKPLIELFSAAVLLPVSAMGLHIEPGAGQLIVVLEAVMVIVFLITFAAFARRFLQMQKLKGGGPLV